MADVFGKVPLATGRDELQLSDFVQFDRKRVDSQVQITAIVDHRNGRDSIPAPGYPLFPRMVPE